MPNTYTQLYVQIVFAVYGRENLINEKLRDELEKILCSIVTEHHAKPLAVYCNPDHVHILIAMNPEISISKMAEAIKSGSSGWLNRERRVLGKFSWQSGYGAFSYSKSQISMVIQYILNQPEHHKRRTFREEYLTYLSKRNILFDEQYLFDFLEEI